ncbi:MAG: hypothetical protein KQ78_00972 [Candidatus Izimaplasma bacterium HR2]|nr:MAG: hypothetical protein KQ78_00972 [Candidatus Izimaplasma bacterium HR2]
MLDCKICGKNLYKNITFNNMFRLDYYVHSECIDKLVFNNEEQVIPIESNTIIYDYVFKELPSSFNKEYLELNYLNQVLEKHIEKKGWSMMILYDELVKKFIQNNNPYLLINLTNYPILLISLEENNIAVFEQL